jgi:pyruvate dehydrogenase E1 component alpha subunit
MPINPNETERVSLLETMLLIRTYEQRLAALNASGVPGTCTSVGQEAAAVGVVRTLAGHDRILTNHRSAAHLLARGANPGRLMAEVMGRSTGYGKGKSGSLHISAQELGVVLTSTIVGGELSLAPGVALAQKMGAAGTGDGITAVFFGDGAATEGIFHESLNLAVTWQLPVLFVCENNQWQAFVHRRETMPHDNVETWARSYGLPTAVVDGNDVEAVLAAARSAAATIRATGRPYFLETVTYRLRGHYEPDDQAYVDAAELAHWRSRDPIDRQRDRLLAEGVIGSGEYAQLQARCDAAIDAAIAYAQSSPWPEAGELLTDVYA